jgi:hypothetical protein
VRISLNNMAIDVAQVPKAYYYKPTKKPVKKGTGLLSRYLKGAAGGGEGVPLASRELINPEFYGNLPEGQALAPTLEQAEPTLGVETQAPIMARAGRAVFTPGSLMDIITSGRHNRANEAYDPAKAIGGDNVPYKPATGVGGWFRRAFMGDSSNTDNIAAQQAQGAKWASDAAAKTERSEKLADQDRTFSQQKELLDEQSAQANARQDALFAQQESRDFMADQAQLDRDALKIGADMEEAALRAGESARSNKPASFEPGKIYPGENFGKPAGTLWSFEVNPLAGKSVMQEVGGKSTLLAPPKADGTTAVAANPMELGAPVEGVIPPEVVAGIGQLGRNIKRNITDTPSQLANDVGAALLGGRVAANPTALTKFVSNPLGAVIDSSLGIPESAMNALPTPKRQPEQTIEDYIKMLRKLQGR